MSLMYVQWELLPNVEKFQKIQLSYDSKNFTRGPTITVFIWYLNILIEFLSTTYIENISIFEHEQCGTLSTKSRKIFWFQMY